MIIIMERWATEGQIADVVERLGEGGARVQRLDGERVTLAITGSLNGVTTPGGGITSDAVSGMAGVASVLRDTGATPQVAAMDPFEGEGRPGAGGESFTGSHAASAVASAHGASALAPTQEGEPGFEVGERWIGGRDLFVVAGPCSVEDPETMHHIAREVAAAGAVGLRAGAFKPRSSPYSFQGMGEEGLAVARNAADAHGLLLVSEVLDATQIPLAARYVDVLQVGSRNMYNTSLLRELGRARRPVLLKRSFSATMDEWLSAAEYVVSAGNPRVILCERGIRTFETATRNTLDLNAVPVIRERSRLPVVVDPSHGTGRRAYVLAMARAAVASGADGLLLEVHVDPDRAVSDGAQTIDAETFRQVMRDAAAIRGALAGE
jgi:3-deoxy-7-phosphoheptulonate synthase